MVDEQQTTEPTTLTEASPPQHEPVDQATTPKDEHFLWLKRSDQLVLGVVLIVCVSLTIVYWVRLSSWGSDVVEINRQHSETLNYQMDINTATWVELAHLSGIGETLALRIVEDRKQHGRYHSIDDLQRVSGIGLKKVDKLRKNVRVVK